tara:strand:+ start:131 stop:880 length:750 start_codon:yes stop_codon:yes gene_type:complete
MSEVNINQIKKSHEELKKLFEISLENQGFAWSKKLYDLLPDSWLEIKGNVTDPDGRTYIAAKLAEDSFIDQIKTSQENPNRYIPSEDKTNIADFSSVAIQAANNLLGIAIISTEENQRPDALLRFGAIWSYCEYGDLAGCGNVIVDFERAFSIDQKNPFDVTVQETDHYTVGKPNEAFFPLFIRQIISEEIKSVYPTATPDFSLLTETRYAMPMSILIQLGINISDNDKRNLQHQLTWYMPPYLPVAVR